jgi:PAS domain-containing protein
MRVRSQTAPPQSSMDPQIASVLGMIPDAAVALDMGGVVLDANDLAVQLFGGTRRDLLGHSLQTLLPIGEVLGAEPPARDAG